MDPMVTQWASVAEWQFEPSYPRSSPDTLTTMLCQLSLLIYLQSYLYSSQNMPVFIMFWCYPSSKENSLIIIIKSRLGDGPLLIQLVKIIVFPLPQKKCPSKYKQLSLRSQLQCFGSSHAGEPSVLLFLFCLFNIVSGYLMRFSIAWGLNISIPWWWGSIFG